METRMESNENSKSILGGALIRWIVVVPVIGILAGMILTVPQYPVRKEDDHEAVLKDES